MTQRRNAGRQTILTMHGTDPEQDPETISEILRTSRRSIHIQHKATGYSNFLGRRLRALHACFDDVNFHCPRLRKSMSLAKYIFTALLFFMTITASGCGRSTSQNAKFTQSKNDLKYLYGLVEEYRISNAGALPARIGSLFDSGKSKFTGIEERILTGFSDSKFLNDRSSLMYFPQNAEIGSPSLPLFASYRTFTIKGKIGHIVLWTNGEITHESVERLDELVLEYHMNSSR